MSSGVNAAVRAPSASARQHRLRRGRTRILAVGDLTMLVVAYTVSYVIADRIAPLPPVSADAWFLALVAVTAPFVWLTVFTAYNLYDNDSLKISVSSFDEVARPLPRDARRLARLPDPLTGRRVFFGWWIYTPVEAVLFLAVALVLIPIVRGSIRSWIFPRMMKPRRTLIVGSGDEARLVYRKIKAHPEYGLEVVGFLGRRCRTAAARAGARERRPTSRASSTSTTSTGSCSRPRSAATKRRSISSGPCGVRTSRSRSCRATSRSSPRTRCSTTSRACRS